MVTLTFQPFSLKEISPESEQSYFLDHFRNMARLVPIVTTEVAGVPPTSSVPSV